MQLPYEDIHVCTISYKQTELTVLSSLWTDLLPSHNPTGLHSLLQGYLYVFLWYTTFNNHSRSIKLLPFAGVRFRGHREAIRLGPPLELSVSVCPWGEDTKIFPCAGIGTPPWPNLKKCIGGVTLLEHQWQFQN
jgi:hypothetical protein